MPTAAAVRVLPHEAQYQRLEAVNAALEVICVPRYCSMTMFPFFNTMRARVPVESRKGCNAAMAAVFHPRLAGVTLVQVDVPVGGK